MGKLVQFDRRGHQPRTRPAPSGEAQIYLFTGVRYERGTPPAPGRPAGSSKVKRKGA